MRLLYTCDYFKPRRPDEMYSSEAAAFVDSGFEFSTINAEALSEAKLLPPPPAGSDVLYRGWMLNRTDYGQLVSVIESCGSKPITNLDAYLLTHHIPNWCNLLQEMTPETVVLSVEADLEAELKDLGWKSFFVKDYVKSLKTSMGSILTDPSQIGKLVEEMEKYRGTIEGGLCIRRVESFEEDSEIRYFVVNGVAHGPDGQPAPDIVRDCAERIDSPFFSIDVALRTDGQKRVVEIGDGQVSDLVGWETGRFVDIWKAAHT